MFIYYLESVSIKLVSIRDIRNPNCARSITYYPILASSKSSNNLNSKGKINPFSIQNFTVKDRLMDA